VEEKEEEEAVLEIRTTEADASAKIILSV